MLVFSRWLKFYGVVMVLSLVWITEGQERSSYTSVAGQNSTTGVQAPFSHGVYNSAITSSMLPSTKSLSEPQTSTLQLKNSIQPSESVVAFATRTNADFNSLTPEMSYKLSTSISNLEYSSIFPSMSESMSQSDSTKVYLSSSLADVLGDKSAFSGISTKEIPTSSSVSWQPESDSTNDFAATYSHFHTPLMSLLVASSSISFPFMETSLPTSLLRSSILPESLITSSSDIEPISADSSSVPEHKKLLMLVLRAEDCSKFSKADFEKMLEKLMAKFGFGDVVPEVSNAKCYSHLNINVTVGGNTPTLRFLPDIGGKNNFTVDVLNRTFRIVKLEKVDLRFEKMKSSNSSSNFIAAVAKHESVAYIAVGVSFGLVLIVCIVVCCIKCCCLRKTSKRFGVPKGTHVRLRPDDYTLTPIPRPTSLYVDYYRGSGTADIYSTTSAGSIASTTPTVEQGVVQPFDTSIVPLEDSSALPVDSSRDPSVESVPVQSDLKTFNIHSLTGKGLKNATDSKEQLNPKQHSRKVEVKPGGVANPTFQRY